MVGRQSAVLGKQSACVPVATIRHRCLRAHEAPGAPTVATLDGWEDDSAEALPHGPGSSAKTWNDRRRAARWVAFIQRTGKNVHWLLRQAITDGGLEQLADVLAIVRETGALDYTQRRAEEMAEKAREQLEILPPSPYRDSMETLTRVAVERDV